MGAFIVRRVAIGIVLLLLNSFVTFFLFFAAPINAARLACGKNCTQAQIDVTNKALGYNHPFYVQWAKFAEGLVVGRTFPDDPELAQKAPDLLTQCHAPCLGWSMQNAKTVNTEIRAALPVTASLALFAVTMWVSGGVLFGVIAAVTRGSPLDKGLVGLTLIVYAFPSFFVAEFLISYVAIQWKLLPYPAYHSISDGGVFVWAENLFLPALSLALIQMAGYVRYTRAFVLESLEEDYIRTARAKGLRKPVVLFKHALRAALTPLVTMVGLDLGFLLGGAIITESIFNMPGMGALAVEANRQLDLPTLVGILVLAGAFVVVANIIVDILYAVIDPRVRVA
jgi:peptide/nickel transport system permease protein